MLAEERQRTIIGMLCKTGAVRTVDLASHFDVSDQTIRRDLLNLEELGILQRTYGGGVVASYQGAAYGHREALNSATKQAIAATASSLVHTGMTVAISPGTTNAAIAHQLNGMNITIITNSVAVLDHVTHPNTKVIATGGEYRPSAKALVGDLTDKALSSYFADIGFIGVSGADIASGLTVTDPCEASALRHIIRVSRRSVTVIDSAKFYRKTREVVAPLRAIHTLITDAGLPEDIREMLKARGVEVITTSPRTQEVQS